MAGGTATTSGQPAASASMPGRSVTAQSAGQAPVRDEPGRAGVEGRSAQQGTGGHTRVDAAGQPMSSHDLSGGATDRGSRSETGGRPIYVWDPSSSASWPHTDEAATGPIAWPAEPLPQRGSEPDNEAD
jgi:hypothetical protein